MKRARIGRKTSVLFRPGLVLVTMLAWQACSESGGRSPGDAGTNAGGAGGGGTVFLPGVGSGPLSADASGGASIATGGAGGSGGANGVFLPGTSPGGPGGALGTKDPDAGVRQPSVPPAEPDTSHDDASAPPPAGMCATGLSCTQGFTCESACVNKQITFCYCNGDDKLECQGAQPCGDDPAPEMPGQAPSERNQRQ